MGKQRDYAGVQIFFLNKEQADERMDKRREI